MKIKEAFVNRTVGFYLTFGAACVAFISSLVYLVDIGDRTFTVLGMLCMLIGAATVLLTLFTDWQWTPMVPAVLYVLGFAFTLNAALPSLSDVWNGVNFIGGNATMGLIFSIAFFVCVIAAIVGCFMNQRKPE